MTLLDDFYSIEQEAPACVRVKINPAHRIYEGHFPGNPVTPGVCLVQICTELLERITGRRLDLTTIKKIKYLNVVHPDDEPFFEFSKTVDDGDTVKTVVNIHDDVVKYAQMSLVYKII